MNKVAAAWPRMPHANGVNVQSSASGSAACKQCRGDLLPLFVESNGRDRLAGLPVPVAGIAEIAFDAMQIGVDPRRILAVLILNKLVRLVLLAVGRPPQGGKRRVQIGRGCRARQAGFVVRHAHHHLAGVNRPAACSITSPSENSVSSSNGRPINCRPSGNP